MYGMVDVGEEMRTLLRGRASRSQVGGVMSPIRSLYSCVGGICGVITFQW